MFPVSDQIIVQNQLGHIHISDHGIKEQTLQRRLAIAMHGRIYAQLGYDGFTAAQFGDALR
jgi:hypothetical protein